MKIYLEYKDNKSEKFWEVSVEGSVMTTRWGKIDSSGQSKKKDLSTHEIACDEAKKLAEKKQRKDYKEVETEISKLSNNSTDDSVKVFDLPIIEFESINESDLARRLKNRSLKSSSEYLTIVYELRTILEKTKHFKKIDYDLKFLIDAFGSCNSGFEVKGRAKKFLKSDPLGSHVMGLMYTSTEFPWPEVNGILAIPRVQINLSQISDLIALDIGAGIVQVFDCWAQDPGDGYIFRHIPAAQVAADKYELTDREKFKESIRRSEELDLQVSYKTIFSDDSKCLEITTLGKNLNRFYQYFFGSSGDEDWIDLEPLDKIEEYINHSLRSSDPKNLRSKKLITELKEAHKKIGSKTVQKEYNATLFGMWDPIQTQPGELSRFTLFDFGSIDSPFGVGKDPSPREINFDGSGAIVMAWSNEEGCWEYAFESDR
jgi:predicted DNA-binding WGR domain protein